MSNTQPTTNTEDPDPAKTSGDKQPDKGPPATILYVPTTPNGKLATILFTEIMVFST